MTHEEKIYSERCQAGCKVFTGGEIKHHPDCQYYPESFTKLYDDLTRERDALKEEITSLARLKEERDALSSAMFRNISKIEALEQENARLTEIVATQNQFNP